MPHLAEAMLTYIEENETTHTALGYSAGEGGRKSDGKRRGEHHKILVSVVLIPDPSGIWKDCKPEDLVNFIKNKLGK
jgi:hypothetical protein